MKTSRLLTLSILILGTSFALLPACAFSKKMQPTAPATVEVPSSADSESVWVGKSDGAKSCAKEKGISLDVMAAQLQSVDIKILAKKKISDGKMRIQMCGADKGDFNGFLIARKDADKAKALGFNAVPGIH